VVQGKIDGVHVHGQLPERRCGSYYSVRIQPDSVFSWDTLMILMYVLQLASELLSRLADVACSMILLLS